jgi:putative ABC transport system permease protein
MAKSKHSYKREVQFRAYRIGIGWWIFGLTGVITVVLTVLTIGWQAVKAATANPVKAIMNCE